MNPDKLFKAVKKGDLLRVQGWIDRWNEIDSMDERGDYPLTIAVRQGDRAMVLLLLSSRPSPTQIDNAIREAVTRGEYQILKDLLSEDTLTYPQIQALFLGADDPEIAQAILDTDLFGYLDINLCFKRKTLLIHAVETGNLELVEWILDRPELDLEVCDQGKRALQKARRRRQQAMIDRLNDSMLGDLIEQIDRLESRSGQKRKR